MKSSSRCSMSRSSVRLANGAVLCCTPAHHEEYSFSMLVLSCSIVELGLGLG